MSEKLKHWAKHYFTFRKAFFNEGYEIQETGEGLLLKHKAHEERVVCVDQLSELNKIKAGVIVTPNTKENVDFLAKNWERFLIPDLRIIFVNLELPNSKWIIAPFVHNKVCDRSNIKKSLETLSLMMKE
ncbi:hypothetical protein DRJ48_00975 [Candidatus Woesearchaeota archaeon]|nr:hypothetical protein [Candidatus Woesearchaeota archaeon]RLE43443.1 MAG: hypothetical protein DRJ48_00975 [Candidatus Woesearchaeota archaeon]